MCYRPITIQNPSDGKYIQVPCGKCLDCLRKYQNAWSNRMFEEYKAKGYKGVFFTLTYDENHVPKNYLINYNVFRSAPDYGYDNTKIKRAKGERIKAAEAPTARIPEYSQATQSGFIDFNQRRSPSKHRALLVHLERLFAQYYSMTQRPLQPLQEHDVDFSSDPHLDITDFDFDESLFFYVDEETGEYLPKRPYQAPVISQYRPRPVVSFNSVRKEDVQLWLKRNRTRFNRQFPEREFSYFITSEYGPRTLRPHYHGVLFGVSKEDVADWFDDWRVHFGEIVRFDDLDINKGGLSYVAKYCSKGSFEHPLCAKDFFYFKHRANNLKDVLCSEYHSKHYEKCIQWFGIDEPIVDPTFHLVSKGLGVDWCKKDPIKCKEFEELCAPERPCYDLDDLLEGRVSLDSYVEMYSDYDSKLKIPQNERDRMVSDWLERFKDRLSYKRVFRIKQKDGTRKEEVFAFALPKYYREKMFGTNLRAAYPNFVCSHNEEVYRQQLGQLDSDGFVSTDAEKVLALEAQSQQELVDNFNAAFDSFRKTINKSQL